MTMLISLCQNAALLTLGVVAYSYARSTMEGWGPTLRVVASGALFAALTMLSMLAPLWVAADIMLDPRVALVALASAFAGPIAGIMAATPAGLYRLDIGGPLALSALCALAPAMLLGWGLRAWATRRRTAITVGHLALLGVALMLAVVAIHVALDAPAARLMFLHDVATPLTVTIMLGVTGFGMLIIHGDQRRVMQRLIRERDQSLRRNQDLVFRILRDELLAGRSLAEQLRAITRITADALAVERVSVWLYDDEYRRASCIERWDAIEGRHVGSPDVWFDELPDLRAVLSQSLTYRVDDTRTDPIARHFRKRYQPGREPDSVLYTAIRRGDRLVGHVALASVGRLRDWRIEEDTFIHSLADLIGIALLRDELERKERMLRRNQELVVRIVQDELLTGRGLDAQLQAITRSGAETLDVPLVSVWRYDTDRQAATCLVRWNAELGAHDRPADVDFDQYPQIRDALSRNLVHKTADAHRDPVLAAFAADAYPDREPMSALYSAIHHGDRLVGNFGVVGFGRRRDWTIEEESFARSLADLVGIALLQDQVVQKERRLRRNQQLLVQLVRDQLLGTEPLEAIIRSMTETIGEALEIDRTSVWLTTPPAGDFRCVDLWDKGRGEHLATGGATTILSAPRVREAFTEALAVVVEDVASDDRLTPEERAHFSSISIKSVLVAAIGGPGQPIGSLAFAATGRKRSWTLEDQTLARSLADLLGLAVLRAELDGREQALRQSQALVTQIVRDELLRTAPLPEILESVTEVIGRTLGIDRTTIWKLDAPSGDFRCLARWDRATERHVLSDAIPITATSRFFEQLRQDIVVSIVDFDTDPRVTPTLRARLGQPIPRSGLLALIGAPDQPIGILGFSSFDQLRDWTLEEQSLARSLSHLIAFALISHSYREAIAALDLVGEGIYVQGPTTEVIYANRAAHDLGLVDGGPMPGRLAEAGDAAELPWYAPDGSRRELAVSRQRLPDGGMVTMLSDVTDQKTRQRRHEQLEDQLRQTTKMEAVGRLAGGIAHDFNNMVGAILGFATFLVEDLPPDSEQRNFAKRITQVCERSRDVVKQLLAFSRPDDAIRSVVDLRTAVVDNGALLKAALPPSTGLLMELGADPLPVLANVGQIYQVLVNLCGNANDALEGNPGTIVVSLALIDRDHPDRRIFEGGGHEPDLAIAIGGRIGADQSYAAIRVADTGGGMLQRTIDQIFEPFFTTKERGHGTGLGLAVVHGIVSAYGGAYVVKSRVGAGSEFSIYLPLVQPVPAAPHDRTGSPRGQESVLVVDDEVDLTDMLSIGLGRLGYDVTCCNDPVEALSAFEQDPDAWDIVVTDQAMPAMKGTAVIKRLKAIRPRCAVILCTGFADGATEEAAIEAGADAFLLKPVEAHRIAQKLRELLDQPPSGPPH